MKKCLRLCGFVQSESAYRFFGSGKLKKINQSVINGQLCAKKYLEYRNNCKIFELNFDTSTSYTLIAALPRIFFVLMFRSYKFVS